MQPRARDWQTTPLVKDASKVRCFAAPGDLIPAKQACHGITAFADRQAMATLGLYAV